jgi:hypothetical protein
MKVNHVANIQRNAQYTTCNFKLRHYRKFLSFAFWRVLTSPHATVVE